MTERGETEADRLLSQPEVGAWLEQLPLRKPEPLDNAFEPREEDG